jgi:hypothetical protein
MARPLKNINWDIVIKRMQAGNTAEQIYVELELNKDTFYNRFKQEFGVGFSDYSDGKAHEAGKGNILYVQYMKALNGNTRMLELLGREWCGQAQEKTSNTSAPNQKEIDKDQLIQILQHKIKTLEENGNKPETG